MSQFTHLDDEGHVRMVDVSAKRVTRREAVARGKVFMHRATFDLLRSGRAPKGDVLATAHLAGVMAAKRTAELIPMCHPLNVTHIQVDFTPDEASHSIGIRAAVRALDQTGVEMEALTAAAVAALTIYDMCKSSDREMTIAEIRLAEKSGGKSGVYRRGARGGK
jgi:cyclic pyranopterin phosphate synthase